MQRQAAAQQNKLRRTPLRATEKRRCRFVRDIAISIGARRKDCASASHRAQRSLVTFAAKRFAVNIARPFLANTQCADLMRVGGESALFHAFLPSRLNAKEAACTAFVAQVKAPLALRRTLCLAKTGCGVYRADFNALPPAVLKSKRPSFPSVNVRRADKTRLL